MDDLQVRAFTDLKRDLEAPPLSALRSTLGLAVASAVLRSFGERATAAGSRPRPAGHPEPGGSDVQAVPSRTVGQGRPSVDVVEERGLHSSPAGDPPPSG